MWGIMLKECEWISVKDKFPNQIKDLIMMTRFKVAKQIHFYAGHCIYLEGKLIDHDKDCIQREILPVFCSLYGGYGLRNFKVSGIGFIPENKKSKSYASHEIVGDFKFNWREVVTHWAYLDDVAMNFGTFPGGK
jgi:hypothetical protein